ncbi:MAG: glycosyltransferase [Paucibacter sp.]|nr:glycosyltransferase [Roseateles sp.]
MNLKTLCIEGWRGVNHSIAMVNQNQILEMARLPGWRLFHRDAPYLLPHWNAKALDSGFSAEERAVIDSLGPPPDEPGKGPIDTCLRMMSPVRPIRPGFARRNASFVVTEFGLTPECFDPQDLQAADLTQGDDFAIAPSHWAKARAVDYGFAPEKVHVVPHGFKSDTFTPLTPAAREHARVALGFKPEETVFCNVGVSTWNKGLDLLIFAFAQLRLRGLPVKLVLKDNKALYGLGVESTFASLAKRWPQVGEASVRDGIVLLSTSLNLGQLQALYSLADAYVSPYRAEGFNLPVLEALGCGTPVIVSGGGATDDFVPPEMSRRIATRPGSKADHPQVDGLFVMPEVDDLIVAMVDIAEGRRPDAATRLRVRAELAQRYSWGAVTRQLMELL